VFFWKDVDTVDLEEVELKYLYYSTALVSNAELPLLSPLQK